MKISFFSTQKYDRDFFCEQNVYGFEINYFTEQLNEKTAILCDGEVICAFVNDKLNSNTLCLLKHKGVKLIALRCAGFNNVDLNMAKELGITVVRVPAYSPQAVAEHALAMIMTLNRKTHKAYNRVREQNFSLNGLLGFNLFGKNIGVVGTGNIGASFCRLLKGFGCKVYAYDPFPSNELTNLGVIYTDFEDILKKSDIISLHCPLNEKTKYIINDQTLSLMKDGTMLINTSRGGLIDTKAVISALKHRKLHSLGIDVYEQEENLFFRDLSDQVIEDDMITRLMSFQNVLITAHQGFFTHEALTQIAQTTLGNINSFYQGKEILNCL